MSKITSNKITIYIDGSSQGNPGPSGIGIYVQGKLPGSKNSTWHLARYIGIRTNNEAEYEALLNALIFLYNRLSSEAVKNIPYIIIKTDSELLYNQVVGIYRVRNVKLKKLYAQVQKLLKKLPQINFQLIPREENRICDRLAKKIVIQKTRHLLKAKEQPTIF
ncbi:MAG: ribonuclease HI family protein [candidate division WOR-3 bacterium]|nr:ribonuclease HI family protein [candidate division WOR-3 bacterium]